MRTGGKNGDGERRQGVGPAPGKRGGLPGRVLGINGLGRIGKLTLWHHVGRKEVDRIVVNQGREIGKDLSHVAQTLEKDSTYGSLHRFLYGNRAERLVEIVDEKRGELRINGVPVTVLRHVRCPRDIPWGDHGVEVVVDCTGRFRDPGLPGDHPSGSLRGHLQGGARKVLVSAPFKTDPPRKPPEDSVALIYGINHLQFNPDRHALISATSCTTTALAHMILPLLEHYEPRTILTASLSTVHAATNTQSVLDAVPKAGAADLRKSRSILNNIIITSTGAAAALEKVVPAVNEIGFMADSVRVPVSTGSLIILNLTFQSRMGQDGASTITARSINEQYREAAEGKQRGLLRFSLDQNVSSDVIGDPSAVIIEACETHTRTGFLHVDVGALQGPGNGVPGGIEESVLQVPVTHAKIFGWYDNEYGSYTNRLADLCLAVFDSL